MRSRLKQFRVRAGMTQSELAAAVGVTQPNYQRWESGAAAIPDAKLKKLAKELETSAAAILGKHPPIETSVYDESVNDKLSHYGEVAVHFSGGGKPLLLSISEHAFQTLHRDLQGTSEFFKVESLANQTVVFRSKAVSDVYFSSEAYDHFGPEQEIYKDHISAQIPDARDWHIIEALSCGEIGIEDYDLADVERVRRMVMITDAQYKELVADGRIKPDELELEKAKNEAETDKIFVTSHLVTYQLSTGQQRTAYVDDEKNLFYAFYQIIDYDGLNDDPMVRLEAEGRHRIIFINKSSLDYVSLPTHRIEEGRIEADADALDAI